MSPLGINDLDSISETLDKHDFTNSKWFKLGLRLGISKPTLDSVEKHHISDIDRCLIECLTAWLKQTDNAKEPTWITLIDCLRSIKENAVADKISEEKKIQSTQRKRTKSNNNSKNKKPKHENDMEDANDTDEEDDEDNTSYDQNDPFINDNGSESYTEKDTSYHKEYSGSDSDSDEIEISSSLESTEELPKKESIIPERTRGQRKSSSLDNDNINTPEIWKCPICDKEINDDTQISIHCDDCTQWFHKICASLTDDMFERLSKEENSFYCWKCLHKRYSNLILHCRTFTNDIKDFL